MNKPSVDFDRYTSNYNHLLQENTKFFTKEEGYFAKYKVDVLRREVTTTPMRLLEFGCGIGRNMPFLRAAFPSAEIEGSDISAASLENARKENPRINFFVEPPNSAVGDRYDVILIAGVFHHIAVMDRLTVMKTISQRISPGGTIFIFEHNPFNPLTRKIVKECPYDNDAVLLRPSELVRLMTDAGLNVQRSAYCIFVPPSLPILMPLEFKLSWLPLGGQYWVKATRYA